MKIRTSYDYPPIPIRSMDWSAVDDDTYDGPGSPIGRGATEAEAIADLEEQIQERVDAAVDGMIPKSWLKRDSVPAGTDSDLYEVRSHTWLPS